MLQLHDATVKLGEYRWMAMRYSITTNLICMTERMCDLCGNSKASGITNEDSVAFCADCLYAHRFEDTGRKQDERPRYARICELKTTAMSALALILLTLPRVFPERNSLIYSCDICARSANRYMFSDDRQAHHIVLCESCITEAKLIGEHKIRVLSSVGRMAELYLVEDLGLYLRCVCVQVLMQ